ncbi:MAG: TraB/GumN family protein [Pseudomonadota bacterium]
MFRLLCVIAASVLVAFPVAARCAGENLLARMEPEARARLEAAANAVPYPTGNFWRAVRGDQVITIVGTYHLDDPRHAATLATLRPMIESATTVLVEAGPQEEKALIDHMKRDPALMLITEGPTLVDMMAPADWNALSAALAARGVPSTLAARFKPWYVNLMLAIPACTMTSPQTGRGLDGMVVATALKAGVPLRALEPYDTLFSLFDGMTTDEQLEMIKATLALDARSADFTVTLTEAYFAQQSRLIWEFMREQSYALPGYTKDRVDRDFARMEGALMSARNRNWLPVLTDAATDGPVFAAFGALHLAGNDGVLALLERDGFTLERLLL